MPHSLVPDPADATRRSVAKPRIAYISCAATARAATLDGLSCAAFAAPELRRRRNVHPCPGAVPRPHILFEVAHLLTCLVSASASLEEQPPPCSNPLSDRGLHLHLRRRSRRRPTLVDLVVRREGSPRPRTTTRLGDHRRRRDRHRARRLEDRQGGRCLPDRSLLCPATRSGRRCWPPSAIAAAEHRQFHRDAGYTEGRRERRSRDNRAMAKKYDVGQAGRLRRLGACGVQSRCACSGRPASRCRTR